MQNLKIKCVHYNKNGWIYVHMMIWAWDDKYSYNTNIGIIQVRWFEWNAKKCDGLWDEAK